MTFHFSDGHDRRDPNTVTESVRPVFNGLYRKFFKRFFDVSILVISAPIIIPVVLLLALILLFKTRDSPFYTQERVGKNGRIFIMWKLRTMVVGADAKLAGYLDANPEAKIEWTRTQKLKNDPRITRTGRFLRKTSLDELPQLWNVLIGDMSLVGPRPMMPEQRAIYSGTDYFDLHPGVTGLWQISDRNECSFSGRVKFDAAYNKTISARTDALILMATVAVVLRGTGH